MLAHHRVPLLLVLTRQMTANSEDLISMATWPISMATGRLLIVLSQPRRPHQPQAVTSPRHLPPNLMEKLSPHSKSDDEQRTPGKLFKCLTIE